ncbi:MAG: hypothetical protein WC767_00190 [Candidatus Paceibacterota bacterium]|jgi:hypothetical protein
MNTSDFPDFSKKAFRLGADFSRWGEGKAGTIAELKAKVDNGWVEIDEERSLIRTAAIHMDVYYRDPYRQKILVRGQRVSLKACAPRAIPSSVPLFVTSIRLGLTAKDIYRIVFSSVAHHFKFDADEEINFSVFDAEERPPVQCRRYPGLVEACTVTRIEYDVPAAHYDNDGYVVSDGPGWALHYVWLPLTTKLQKGLPEGLSHRS